jgi:transcription initiation factor TFIIIB Brf1 subunit/transcription initiation factor TFIIB
MSNAFDLFNLIKKEENIEVLVEKCKHVNVINDKSVLICQSCGEEQFLDAPQKGDYIRTNESNHFCVRKPKEKSIYSDIQNVDMSDHIKDIANEIYNEVCKEKVHRGTRRKAIIFASVFYAYKTTNDPQSCETLIRLFNIKRKDALKGLKFVNDNITKHAFSRSVYITPEHLVCEFLDKFMVSDTKKDEIISLYRKIKNKSTTLNRSRPQSVASGVIWYWIQTHNTPIGIKDFIKKVDLSELTVLKMAKEVARIYEIN